MSGLCVAVTFDGTEVPPDMIHTMVAPAAHRGPDGTRVWTGTGAGGAHLALQVTSHDRRDRQPLLDETLVCLSDARLDNRNVLMEALSTAGHGHTGDPTDNELILAAYRRWGRDCAAHLVGDFAFVIWDIAARCLFAARDPMGARTLYYRIEPRRRAFFASEPKQIVALPEVPREPNQAALLADIAGLYALPEMSHYAGIDQLAPGHSLLVDGGGHRTWPHWKLDVERRIRHRSPEVYAERFRELLREAVASRLRTDRPAGIFLSGGIDAMAVAATGARLVGHREGFPALRGFSWAFDDLRNADERSVSSPLAAQLGITVTDIPGDDAWPLKPGLDWEPDETDPYTWLFQSLFTRTLAAARDQNVRAMITNDRGDEMVGNWPLDELGLLLTGNVRALLDDRRAYLQRTGNSSVRFAADRLVKPLLVTLWPPGGRVRARLRKFAGRRPRPFAPWVPESAARRFHLQEIAAAATPIPQVHGQARLQRIMTAFNVISLRIAQLRERTFSRYGLQYVDPWGDVRVAEFVSAIPQWVVQREREPKKLLRDAMKGVLPDQARLHSAPTSNTPLFQRAFNEREVHTVRSLLRNSRAEAAGLLDASAVLDSYESYLRREGQAYDFWFPLTVEVWLRRWWD